MSCINRDVDKEADIEEELMEYVSSQFSDFFEQYEDWKTTQSSNDIIDVNDMDLGEGSEPLYQSQSSSDLVRIQGTLSSKSSHLEERSQPSYMEDFDELDPTYNLGVNFITFLIFFMYNKIFFRSEEEDSEDEEEQMLDSTDYLVSIRESKLKELLSRCCKTDGCYEPCLITQSDKHRG